MASLKRFEAISQCGVFRDFHWLQECAGQPRMRDFADINIIYGWNGTGKSTFSRLLGGLDDGRVAEFPESRYALVDSEGRTFRQGEQFPSAIRVFKITPEILRTLVWA